MFHAYKTELDLNNRQKTLCAKFAGAARFAYNWGLVYHDKVFKEEHRHITAFDLCKELNAIKKDKFPWILDIPQVVPERALVDVGRALEAFFRAKKNNKKTKYPKFRTRKTNRSFRVKSNISIYSNKVRLSTKLGPLKLKESNYLPTSGVKILSATVSESCGRWYISVSVEEPDFPTYSNNGPVVGIDLGLRAFATLSDGTVLPNQHFLARKMKKIKRLQRAVSRSQKESNNRKRAVLRFSKLHKKVRLQRLNAIHQITTTLTKTKSVIVIEDLNIRGMMKNHSLALAISDMGWYEFRRQLEYKSSWYGSHIVVVNRWEPTSKTCSNCGSIKQDLSLKERTYHCSACGISIDRDLNAARNLEKLAGSSSDSLNACGIGSAGLMREHVTKLPMKSARQKKQEPDMSSGERNRIYTVL